MIVVTSSLSKILVFKMFSFQTETQSRYFKIPPFEDVFKKLYFRDGLVDGKPNRRNKAAFLKFLRRSTTGALGYGMS